MKIPGSRTIKKAWDRLNKRGLILMYHRIASLDFDPRLLNVSPTHLNEHIQIIKKYGKPVQVHEFGRNLKLFSFREKEIAVTFNDGYADNFNNAKSILEKHDIPATFFIITGSIDSREEFFWDDLEQLILAPPMLPPVFEAIIGEKEYRWQIISSGSCQAIDYSEVMKDIPRNNSTLSRSQLYRVVNQIIGTLFDEERKDALRSVAQWTGQALTTRPDCLPMTSADLISLSKCSLFEIGAHTVTHPKLSCVSLERQKEEIVRSKQDLETQLNRTISSFSYPHGAYSQQTVELVKQAGFKNACTVVDQFVTRNMDPYLMPRFAVCDWDGKQFEEKLKQWLNYE